MYAILYIQSSVFQEMFLVGKIIFERVIQKDRDFSRVRSLFLRVIPPGAEKPARQPSVRMTRWQGIISGNGFRARAFATARAEWGQCIVSAKAE